MLRSIAAALLMLAFLWSANASELDVPADGSTHFTGQGTVVTVFNAGAKPADVTVKCAAASSATAPVASTTAPTAAIETVTIASGAGVQIQADTSRGCAVIVRGGPITLQY
jgi:hypothetical protein